MNLERSQAKARRIEEVVRQRAMLPLPFEINGWTVRQFTLRHFSILIQLGSPFVCGGPARIEDVGVFLWVVSPEYDHSSFVSPYTLWGKVRRFFALRKRKAFMARLSHHPRWGLFEPRIRKYLARAFMDRPPSGPGKSIAACYDASMIHRIAIYYHWTEDEIYAKPMARLFQYLNWISAPTNQPQFFPLQSAVISRYYAQEDAAKGVANG